jgi:hypothetical protein
VGHWAAARACPRSRRVLEGKQTYCRRAQYRQPQDSGRPIGSHCYGMAVARSAGRSEMRCIQVASCGRPFVILLRSRLRAQISGFSCWHRRLSREKIGRFKWAARSRPGSHTASSSRISEGQQ